MVGVSLVLEDDTMVQSEKVGKVYQVIHSMSIAGARTSGLYQMCLVKGWWWDQPHLRMRNNGEAGAITCVAYLHLKRFNILFEGK